MRSPSGSGRSSQSDSAASRLKIHKIFPNAMREVRQPILTLPAIKIQGLNSALIQPSDFCIPHVRPHPSFLCEQEVSGHIPIVEHLDISTTWNGLTWAEAHELIRIHRAFIATLERMLARELWQIYQQSLQQASATAEPFHPLYTIGIVRGISFCRNQLVGEMADTLYLSREDIAKSRMGLFPLYMAANDSLVNYNMDEFRDTSITVRVYCDPNSMTPSPIVEAAWIPDTIHFENLSDSLKEGEEFSIVPRYQRNAAFGAARFPENISYIISSTTHQLSWLSWSNELGGFKGVVPLFSEIPRPEEHLEDGFENVVCPLPEKSPRHVEESRRKRAWYLHEKQWNAIDSLQFEVKAVLIDDNGSFVRYERIVRARFTLKIIPWNATCTARGSESVSNQPRRHQNGESAACDMQLDNCHTKHSLLIGNQHRGSVTAKKPIDRVHTQYALGVEGCCLSPSPPTLGCQLTSLADTLGPERFAAALSVTKPMLDAIELINLAKRHTDLGARYKDLAQRHADIAKHVNILTSAGDFRSASSRADIYGLFAESSDARVCANRLGGCPQLSKTARESSYGSMYTTKQNNEPSSPIVRPCDQILVQSAVFSSLPPPANLVPSQTFNHEAQAWERVLTPQGTAIHDMLGPVSPATEAHSDLNLSTSDQGSRKRRARSSLTKSSQRSPPKRARDNGRTHAQHANTTTISQTSSRDIGEYKRVTAHDYYARPGLHSETLEQYIRPSRVLPQVLARTQDENCSMSDDVEIVTEWQSQARKLSREQQAALWALHFSAATGDMEHLGPMEEEALADCEFARPLRGDSGDTPTYSGKATVSSAECLEAMAMGLGRLLSGPSKAGVGLVGNYSQQLYAAQPEMEPKLSEEEQRALDQAIARSMEDVTGRFEDVFLDSSCNSSSDTDSKDDDGLKG